MRTTKHLAVERDLRILKETLNLAKTEGFLGFTIAELAKASEVSIGTFYTRFNNKEDLIVALAAKTWQGRMAGLDANFKNETLQYSDRLISAVFCDFLFSLDHPELFVSEQLAGNSTVWNAASLRWKNEMLSYLEKTIILVASAAHRAIESGGFMAWKDSNKQAAFLDKSVWTLMVGSSYIVNAEDTMKEKVSPKGKIPDFLKESCLALFTGYGWASKKPRADITRIADYSCRQGHLNQLVDTDSFQNDPFSELFIGLNEKKRGK